MSAVAVAAHGPAARERGRAFVALAVVATLWLGWSIALRPLSLPEEGRYVGVAWEMLRSGHWLTPTENGLPFFHKPPLFYWLAAASMATFGATPAAARVAPLLGALGGLAVFAWVVARRAGDAVAAWTVAVLLAMPAFVAAAQFANLDMLVAGCIAASIALGAEGAIRLEDGRPAGGAIVGAWVAAALGVLAKGLIGVVLPGLVLLVWLLVEKRWRIALRLLLHPGLAAFAAVAAPWFVAVSVEHPGFADFFFRYQHVQRFAGGGDGFNSVQPWWFYAACVPLATLPWSPWLLFARPPSGARATTPGARWTRLLWIWIAVVLAFFSIPASKPIGYAVPVLFPIAALVAQALAARSGTPGGRRRGAVCLALGAVLSVLAVAAALRFDRHGHADLAQALRQHRAPGDPVVFVDDFFFDVPVLAGLDAPVAVASDWQSPDIDRHDNWKRELHEGARFAPSLAATLLVDADLRTAGACPARTVWLLAPGHGQPAGAPAAVRVATGRRGALWRIDPRPSGC